ncbi:hypothetical protein D049_0343A, partial [Vibrio parahaemolyticus VPTS-2010]
MPDDLYVNTPSAGHKKES